MRALILTFSIGLFIHLGLMANDGLDSTYNKVKSIAEIVNKDNEDNGYTPQNITDSILLDLQTEKIAEESPLVTFLLTNNNYTKSIDNREVLTSLLGLPLAIRYNNTLTDYNLKLSDSIDIQLFSNKRDIIDIELPDSIMFRLAQGTIQQLQRNNVSLFTTDEGTLNKYSDKISIEVKGNIPTRLINAPTTNNNMLSDASGQYATDIRVKHWVPNYQTSIQFSENYVSDNWYKGGASNLNLYMRNYFSLMYKKDDVLWLNEIESKLNTYNDSPTNIKNYRIADDQFRISSNYGIKAIKTLYYTLDTELRTQIFKSYNKNKTRLRAAFLAPMNLNVGLGMMYDYSYKSEVTYGRRFTFSLNIAPLSYTFRYSRLKDIDLSAFALTADKPYYHKFGSTIRSNWTWNINLNTTWRSRVFFNTSYSNVEAEWENTIDMAISKYFSTRIYLNLRYDDSVPPSANWNKRLQINQLLSFGITYKLQNGIK